MSRNIKVMFVVVAVLALAGAAYGFAAANTAPTTAAGYVAKTVSGYDITNVAYNLKSDRSMVDTITFDIAPHTTGDPLPVTVDIQTSTSGSWTNCIVTPATGDMPTSASAVCTPGSSLAVVDVTALNIVASSTADTTLSH
jgi:hypothetical protein